MIYFCIDLYSRDIYNGQSSIIYSLILNTAAYEYTNRHGRSVRGTLFLLLSKIADLSGHIHTKVEKRTAYRFFISQINYKNGESENESYKIYYCR